MHRFTLSQRGNLVKIHLDALFSQRNVVKYHWDIQYVMEVRYQHHNHLVAEQATQMFSKNSGLKVAQINCIRMDIVFCVPQQLLMERTNFHLGPNSFYREKM